MLKSIAPKLPMRDKSSTLDYYSNSLGFEEMGSENFLDYLILKKDQIELHFFLHKALNPTENYAQVYIRVQNIEAEFQKLLDANVEIHPNGHLSIKPWEMKEFALLDPDKNLLTFGEYL